MNQDGTKITHKFVMKIPARLKPGTLYLSLKYATAVHLCACGCGNEIVTPLSPPGWSVTFNGETVSLSPSIGNWLLPCRSHYWIRNDEVQWSYGWSSERIAAAQERDRRDVEVHFSRRDLMQQAEDSALGLPAEQEAAVPARRKQ